MTQHPALRRFHDSLTDAERREYGAFVSIDTSKPNPAGNLMAKKAEEVFVELLGKHNRMGLSCSPSPSATYAPSMFERDQGSQGIKKRAFADAMKRLLESGAIIIDTDGPPARQRKRLWVKGPHMKGGNV